MEQKFMNNLTEKITENLKFNDREKWAEAFEDIMLLACRISGICESPEDFSENEKYDALESFTEICKAFANDRRSIGTIIKQITD